MAILRSSKSLVGKISYFFIAIGFFMTGCQSTSSLPMRPDLVKVSVSTAPICGRENTEQAALHQAAVQTLRSGYDAFIIVDEAYANNVRTVPTGATVSTSGTATLSPIGSSVIVAGNSTSRIGVHSAVVGRRTQELIVQMYKHDEPAAATAFSARNILGPDWEKALESDKLTCF